MELIINVIEAAAELAEIYVNEDLKEEHLIYEVAPGDCLMFTEEAQNLFNYKYDQILERLMDAQIKTKQ